jgi:hypothetical protein
MRRDARTERSSQVRLAALSRPFEYPTIFYDVNIAVITDADLAGAGEFS